MRGIKTKVYKRSMNPEANLMIDRQEPGSFGSRCECFLRNFSLWICNKLLVVFRDDFGQTSWVVIASLVAGLRLN